MALTEDPPRRVYFSFDYQNDLWRASLVRHACLTDRVFETRPFVGPITVEPQAAAGWTDTSIWEQTEKMGEAAMQALIQEGLRNTSVTVVLIGMDKNARWLDYEIEQSVKQGNGLLGIYVSLLTARLEPVDPNLEVALKPAGLTRHPVLYKRWVEGLLGYRTVDVRDPTFKPPQEFTKWVEWVAVRAGHPCLRHGARNCAYCGR